MEILKEIISENKDKQPEKIDEAANEDEEVPELKSNFEDVSNK
jgi:hypothetical protein